MKKPVLALGMLGSLPFASEPVIAQSSQNGPYYANPSWDQQLPDTTRFIVLLNWNSAAVLDRVTGLVWERTPSSFTHVWEDALFFCHAAVSTGNRVGWRLPSVEELASLVELTPTRGWPAVFQGIDHTQGEFWTSSTVEGFPAQAYAVNPIQNNGGGVNEDRVSKHGFWCVRGGASVQNPQ